MVMYILSPNNIKLGDSMKNAVSEHFPYLRSGMCQISQDLNKQE